MISRNEKIRCGWCSAVNSLGKWNDLTYSKCTSRQMKRAFTQLTEEKAFLRKSDTFYLCPSCGKWSRGSQLSIIDSDNPKLMRLGGEPVFGSYLKK